MPRPPEPSRETRAEDAELARQVSLRRVARLFRQDRRPLAVVVAVIVASSIVAMASPFLLRAVIDEALPQRDLRQLPELKAAGPEASVQGVLARLRAGGHENVAALVLDAPVEGLSVVRVVVPGMQVSELL